MLKLVNYMMDNWLIKVQVIIMLNVKRVVMITLVCPTRVSFGFINMVTCIMMVGLGCMGKIL